YSEEEIIAVVDEATRRRSYVMAHAYTAETIARAVELGVRSIEHGNLIDTDAAILVAKNHAYVVPTLITYETIGQYGKDQGAPKTTLEKLSEVQTKGLEAIEICNAAGVKVGLGTDLLGSLHSHQLGELRLRSEVDSPFQVLRSATSINAEIVQKPDELGCIREGAYADMLIIDGNPLEDLSLLYDNQKGLRQIIKGGVLQN
ncbi:MAG: amidohydrolase family protein, partial [bacterium]